MEIPILPDAFARAGLIPSEATYWRWTITASDAPTRSRGDSVVAVQAPVARPCAVCGSHQTRCLYAERVASKEPSDTREYVCAACGRYSLYRWEGW